MPHLYQSITFILKCGLCTCDVKMFFRLECLYFWSILASNGDWFIGILSANPKHVPDLGGSAAVGLFAFLHNEWTSECSSFGAVLLCTFFGYNSACWAIIFLSWSLIVIVCSYSKQCVQGMLIAQGWELGVWIVTVCVHQFTISIKILMAVINSGRSMAI